MCKIITEVDGRVPETRLVTTQEDGTTQTSVCPGTKMELSLGASADNPFVLVVLSGQEAEWIKVRLE